MRHATTRARTARHNGAGPPVEPQSFENVYAESPFALRSGDKGETRPDPARPARAHLLTEPWFRYGFSLLISGWALVGTYLLNSHLPQTPTPLLFAAVALAARYGGLGPGLLCTFICAMSLSIVLEDPVGTPSSGGSGLLHLAVFVLVSLLVSTVTERARRAAAQARADATRLAILADVSRAFTAAMPDHQATLQTAALQMGDALADACVISLLSEDGQWLRHVAWHHRDRSALSILGKLYTNQQYPADDGLAGRALSEDRSIVILTSNPDEIRGASRAAYAPFLEHFPVYSIASLPLKVRGRNIRTLTLWRSIPRKPFTLADLDLLEELAHRSALAIESARLSGYYQALFRQAPQPMVVLNSELQILDANPAVAELLRSPLEDLQRKPIDTAVSADAEFLETLRDELRVRGQ